METRASHRRMSSSAESSPLHLSVLDMGELALNIIDHIPAMVAYWDHQQIYRFANHSYYEAFGKTRSEVIGMHLKELLEPDFYAENLPHIQAALDGETRVFERKVLSKGAHRYTLSSYIPDAVNGFVRGVFVHVTDITPLKSLEHELHAAKERAEYVATHDFLTGLPNRVLLEDRITEAILHAKRTSTMIAVISLDMDNFKLINDSYGHAMGDCVLKEISHRVTEAMRESDTVTRLGGDEFILLATSFDTRKNLELVLNRVLDSARRPLKCLADQPDPVTPGFSIGVALYPANGLTANELMLNSDYALYQAKKAGKNRYVFAENTPVQGDLLPIVELDK